MHEHKKWNGAPWPKSSTSFDLAHEAFGSPFLLYVHKSCIFYKKNNLFLKFSYLFHELSSKLRFVYTLVSLSEMLDSCFTNNFPRHEKCTFAFHKRLGVRVFGYWSDQVLIFLILLFFIKLFYENGFIKKIFLVTMSII